MQETTCPKKSISQQSPIPQRPGPSSHSQEPRVSSSIPTSSISSSLVSLGRKGEGGGGTSCLRCEHSLGHYISLSFPSTASSALKMSNFHNSLKNKSTQSDQSQNNTDLHRISIIQITMQVT